MADKERKAGNGGAGTALRLTGEVVQRSRRKILTKAKEEKTVREFTILSGGNVYSLGVWDDRPDYNVGDTIMLEVVVKSVAYGKVNLNPAQDSSRRVEVY